VGGASAPGGGSGSGARLRKPELMIKPSCLRRVPTAWHSTAQHGTVQQSRACSVEIRVL
jgi:hypothetical protein